MVGELTPGPGLEGGEEGLIRLDSVNPRLGTPEALVLLLQGGEDAVGVVAGRGREGFLVGSFGGRMGMRCRGIHTGGGGLADENEEDEGGYGYRSVGDFVQEDLYMSVHVLSMDLIHGAKMREEVVGDGIKEYPRRRFACE